MVDTVMIIGYLFGQKKELDHGLISCYKINSNIKKIKIKVTINTITKKKNGAFNHKVNKAFCTKSRYFKAETGKISL